MTISENSLSGKIAPIFLNSNWRFTEMEPRGQSVCSDLPWMPATVPGYVHLDLVANDVIKHPFQGMAERACAWVDETDWVYEKDFEVEEVAEFAFLKFGGLDTIAEVYLNGELLGKTDNMFIPHEFPVGSKHAIGDAVLKEGNNTLRVIFRSALRVGKERLEAWAAAGRDSMEPHWARWAPRSFVRKAQYMFGWDWGPELASCGIFRDVTLTTCLGVRIVSVDYDYSFIGGESVEGKISVSIERLNDIKASVLFDVPKLSNKEMFNLFASGSSILKDSKLGGNFQINNDIGIQSIEFPFHIENVRRWYPNGYGEPEAYEASVKLTLDDSSRGITHRLQMGFREIVLVREPDADGKGEGFKFRVNGIDVFAKGANWIPYSSFPINENNSVITDVYKSLEAARDSGMNMLRIWGGGIYEDERFYSICSKMGIMVWQDFPFGCAYYPDTDEFAESVRIEAENAVKRIRNYPSLALWCGNNENHEMYHDAWEGKENRPPRFLGEKLYHEVLPDVVARLDPKTPYWPSSPYGGEDPQSEDYGDRHNWNVWHTKGQNLPGVEPGDWPNYMMDRGRFSSEFGFASSCGMAAWETCLRPEDKSPRSPVVRWHDKTRKGYDKYLGYIGIHFPDPQTLEDLVYYSQINQAEALKCGIEHWRRNKGRCWGTLFWQLNDCWPVQSWAVMDSQSEPKAALWWAKKFYAPVLLSMVREGNTVHAHLTNDLLEHVQGDVTLSIETFDGVELISETFEANIAANATGIVGSIDISPVIVHARDVYVYARFEPLWEIGQTEIENFLFLVEPKDLRLSNSSVSIDVQPGMIAKREHVCVTAKRFAPYLWLHTDKSNNLNNKLKDMDNFFHLRAGKSRTFEIAKTNEQLASNIRVRTL